jgi:hypothetical protein
MAQQTLPEGVTILPAELKRIADAMDALDQDNHAPRQISVVASLHIHQEYPKHLQFGKETRVVNNRAEELAAIEEQLALAQDAAKEEIEAASQPAPNPAPSGPQPVPPLQPSPATPTPASIGDQPASSEPKS